VSVHSGQMLVRKAFRTGRCTVVAIPKKYAEALKILPGTVLTLTIRDRALIVSRALVTNESHYAGDIPASAGTTVREKGL
jgi:antitoxin component of MazEF toxin-antitoxin module